MYSWAQVAIPQLPESTSGVPNQLVLHDSVSGQPLPVAADQSRAGMYVCGITPYDATHLGHANTYVAFDLVNRVLRDLGKDVTYIQNVTDVDDPLLERAQQTGQDWEELAEDQTELFRRDMTDLRVVPPAHYVGAVEAIPRVVELIEQLADSGLIYQVADDEYPDWYFSPVEVADFGQISQLSPEQMLSVFAERGGDPERPGKRDPLDCLLWRMARPGEPSWESSLGAGRPGWHIECTAIALQHLGPNFDVQGGGADLRFPHHEMCAAEAHAATGKPMAQVYVHSGMVGLGGEKMSKSKGNLELVSRLRHAGVDPMAIRLAIISQHYRCDWEWQPQLLAVAEQRLAAWRGAVAAPSGPAAAATIAKLRRALRNDLDTAAAIAAVDDWVAESAAGATQEASAPRDVAGAVDALLGIALN